MSSTRFDIAITCRVCLQYNNTIFPLFSSSEHLEYADILKKVANLKMEENDGFPSVICAICAEELMRANRFISKCKDSNEKLKQLVKVEKCLNEEYVQFGNIFADNIKQEIKDDCFTMQDESFETSDKIDNDSFHSDDQVIARVKKCGKKKNRNIPYKYPVQCSVCGLVLKHKSTLITHRRTHTGEKPFTCSHCGKSFRDKGTMKAHEIRFHSDIGRTFSCDACGKLFYRKSDLNVHLRVHSGLTPYSCSFCSRAFTQVGSLSKHLTTHSKDRPFTCDICGKTFSIKPNLISHMLVHSDVRKYTCSICGMSFKAKSALRVHTRAIHGNPGQHICDVCGGTFSSPGNLKQHAQRRHSVKSGMCSVCNKHFSDLDQHLRTHSKETPFQCAICHKSYVSERQLRVHTTDMHNNSGKFPCNSKNCKKTFHRKSMLEYHTLKFHKNETPHICSHCDRGFFRICDLKTHIFKSHKNVDSPTLKIADNKVKNEKERNNSNYSEYQS